MGLAVEAGPEGPGCRLRYSEFLAGFGALHGGAVGALLEFAATVELLQRRQADSGVRLISLTIEFLRAGRLEDAFARAYITRQGRRVANVRAEAWQGEPGRVIATAHASFSLE
jgi:acyl-coenzyme A thioesterase PaaI-like protein